MAIRHRAIIKKLGGYVALANELGLHPETVHSWAKWDRGIPPRYWPQVARISGLSVDYLRRTHPRPDPPRRAL